MSLEWRNNDYMVPLEWQPERKKKEERPKTTRRRTVQKERKQKSGPAGPKLERGTRQG